MTTTTSAQYSETMKAKMGSVLEYRHEEGMNYASPLHGLIIGSCLQTPADVDTLKKEGVGVIFNLQEDQDMAHFHIDIEAIQRHAAEVGIEHVRSPITDFDPLSLRRHLPDAVRRLRAAMAKRPAMEGEEEEAPEAGSAPITVYIHCTAGLGRAPGVALAYMFWILGINLDEAYRQLYQVRRCHPQLKMIRAATCDLLAGGEGARVPVCLRIKQPGATSVEIAGLDVGWKSRLPLKKAEGEEEFVLEHTLPPGSYQYKYVIDGTQWLPNLASATVEDNGNVNNVVDVSLAPGSKEAERHSRLMESSEGGAGGAGQLTEEEQQQLRTLMLQSAPSV